MTTTRAFLSRAAAAEYVRLHGLRLARGTLQKYASTGGGSRFHKFGQRCVYRREDLDAWYRHRQKRTDLADGHRGQPRPDPCPGRGSGRGRLARGAALPTSRSPGYRLQRPGQVGRAGGRPITATEAGAGGGGYDRIVRRLCRPAAPEPVAWLWEGWLARGKVRLLAGSPGTGKTSVALALAATLTTAGRWPDGSTAAKGSVLIWSGEDDPRDTLVPRLIACGADLSRIHFVGSVIEEAGIRAFDPARDADLLRDHAATMDPPPVLLIVDPIVSAVRGDSHKNAEVRRGLQPLVDLARAVRCVVLGIPHFTKGTAGRDPVERVTGSLASVALARVVLAGGQGVRGGRRRTHPGLCEEQPGAGRGWVRLRPGVAGAAGSPRRAHHPSALGRPLEGSARELLGKAESVDDPDERSALEDAKARLRHTLGFGALDGKELKRLARIEGIPERTLYYAAGILMRARGNRLSVASRTPLTEQQRTRIRAHKVELLWLLTQAVPSPAELKGEDREAIEERATFRTLDGGASRKVAAERPPSSMRVYRYRLLDKPDTWLTMIAPDCDLEEARRSLALRFGKRLTAVVEHLRGC